MFKGEDSVTFESQKTMDEVFSEVEETLRELGRVTISKKGSISVEPKSKYKTTFADTVIEGSLDKNKKNPNQFTLSLTYNVSPTIVCWIVAVIGTTAACVGFLVLLFPYKMKKDLGKDVLKLLASIEESAA